MKTLTFALAFALVLAPPLLAQQPARHLAVADDDAVIESVRELDAAFARGDWRFVSTRAQELLDGAIAPVVAPEPKEGGNEATDKVDTSWVRATMFPDASETGALYTITEYVNRRLSAMPAAGIAEYRGLQDARAKTVLDAALARGDAGAVLDVSRRFRLTTAGARALLWLGHGALERGDAGEAALHFDDLRAITFDPALAAVPRKTVLAGLAMAWSRLGERRLVATLLEEAKTLGDVRLGGESVALAAAVERWRDASRVTEAEPGPTGKLDGAWSFKAPPTSSRRHLPRLRCRPVVADGTVFYHTREMARAVDLATGKIRWTRALRQDRKHPYPQMGPSHSLHQRSLRGAVGEGLYVFVVRPGQDGLRRPVRTLVALDVRTGRIRWALRAGPRAPWLERTLHFDETPVIMHGALFITATDGRPQPGSYLIQLDPETGATRWTTRIGGGVPLPYHSADGDLPNAAHWVTSLPPLVARGLVFAVDNLGTLAVVEAATGRPRFSFRYPRRDIEGGDRNRMEDASLHRGWESNPLRIDGNRLVFAPDDADHVHLVFTHPPLDAERIRRNANLLRIDAYPRGDLTSVVGYRDGVIYLTGRDEQSREAIVEAVCLQDPRHPETYHRWRCSAPLESPVLGLGTVAQNGVYVCSHKYVYRVDLETGAVRDPLISREADGVTTLGNVVLADGSLLVGHIGAVSCHRAAGN